MLVERKQTLFRPMFLSWAFLYVIWIAITSALDFQELLTGLGITLVITWLTLPRLQWLNDIKLTPSLPWDLLCYLWIFLGALLKANVDMARRVLSPQLPINPAIVEIQTGLQSPLGRLLLANSITLTPGTLTVDVIDDHLQVHWIDQTPGTDLQSATRAIAEPFEKYLQRILV
jgi:multicomponent Na+:H+ antiporter subunit E